jgi:hypothetical protein
MTCCNTWTRPRRSAHCATWRGVCRGLLYFGVLTREDWEQNCDQSRTDPAVSLRGGNWYRRELGKRFLHLGAGFWLRRGCPVTVWEMDTAGGS